MKKTLAVVSVMITGGLLFSILKTHSKVPTADMSSFKDAGKAPLEESNSVRRAAMRPKSILKRETGSTENSNASSSSDNTNASQQSDTHAKSRPSPEESSFPNFFQEKNYMHAENLVFTKTSGV